MRTCAKYQVPLPLYSIKAATSACHSVGLVTSQLAPIRSAALSARSRSFSAVASHVSGKVVPYRVIQTNEARTPVRYLCPSESPHGQQLQRFTKIRRFPLVG
jgi:hypothetical protein